MVTSSTSGDVLHTVAGVKAESKIHFKRRFHYHKHLTKYPQQGWVTLAELRPVGLQSRRNNLTGTAAESSS